MQLFNIGAEGQLYLGAIGASWIALRLGDQDVTSTPLYVVAMCVAAAALGAFWALIPGVLRAFARTNEIITSLMLNYVAGLLLTYLIFDSASYWRDTSTLQARAFPQGKPMPEASNWPTFGSSVVVPLGFLVGILAALALWVLYSRMRFGFEVGVIADSPRAARYAGMRTRRKILAVMAVSGGIAGIGGASQIGDFTYTLDGSPTGLQAAAFGYTGIVVAALARYNPFAVCLVAVLIGGLQNAGYTLQGPDFPSGLVGVMQGIILFCGPRRRAAHSLPASVHADTFGQAGRGARVMTVNDSLLVIVLAQAVLYGTPLLYAALGELLAERSGVLNLGVEGMMLFGAAVGYWVDADRRRLLRHGSHAGRARGGEWAERRWRPSTRSSRSRCARTRSSRGSRSRSSRAAWGCRRTSGPRSASPICRRNSSSASLDVLGLGDLPVLGPILFDQSALVYASWVVTLLVGLYLGRTRLGLNVRAVGEAPASADAMGINVALYRYAHVLAGGAFAGVGGACYSLSITRGLDRGRHARERRRLDRDRTRDLRVLESRALSRGRVPLRGALRAPVRPPGA